MPINNVSSEVPYARFDKRRYILAAFMHAKENNSTRPLKSTRVQRGSDCVSLSYPVFYYLYTYVPISNTS